MACPHHALALSNSPRRYATSPPAISESIATTPKVAVAGPAARSSESQAASVRKRRRKVARIDGLVTHSTIRNRRTPLVAETPSLLNASTYQK
jgi:hypothetical protein